MSKRFEVEPHSVELNKFTRSSWETSVGGQRQLESNFSRRLRLITLSLTNEVFFNLHNLATHFIDFAADDKSEQTVSINQQTYLIQVSIGEFHTRATFWKLFLSLSFPLWNLLFQSRFDFEIVLPKRIEWRAQQQKRSHHSTSRCICRPNVLAAHSQFLINYQQKKENLSTEKKQDKEANLDSNGRA